MPSYFKRALSEVLGARFELIRPIGAGGVGQVYLVRDRQTAEEAAIKFISAEHFHNAAQRRAFLREVRSFVRLCHPHIVRLFDFDVPTVEAPYLVMEYLGGKHGAVAGAVAGVGGAAGDVWGYFVGVGACACAGDWALRLEAGEHFVLCAVRGD